MDSKVTTLPNEPRKAVHEAVLSLPCATKSAYIRAFSESTSLIESESSPLQYLRMTQNNYQRAAQLVANYWELRFKLFGDAAFRPMTASGFGALNQADLEVLNSGFLAQMPARSDDKIVVFYDRRRMDEDFDSLVELVPNILRCAFYLTVAASQQQSDAVSGIFLYFCGGSYTLSPVDEEVTKGLLGVLEVCPFQVESVELLLKPPRSGRGEYLESIVPTMTQIMERHVAKGSSLVITLAKSLSSLMTTLQSKGFAVDGIPASAGGRRFAIASVNKKVSHICFQVAGDIISTFPSGEESAL